MGSSLLVLPVRALQGSPARADGRRLPAPEALARSVLGGASPRTCHHAGNSSAGCSKLRYETLSWSLGLRGLCRFPTGPGGTATVGLRQSRSPSAAPDFSSPLEVRGGREFLLFGTTSAKWTLHKLCTLVQSKLSICELSYLMLRMKTSKRGGGGF